MSDLLECPVCHEMTSPGAFCEHCGASLEQQGLETEAEAPPTILVESALPKAEREPPPASGSSPDPDFIKENDCPDFQLECNVARFFIVNVHSSFAFRLRAKSDDSSSCRDIRLEVVLSHNKGEKLERRIWGLHERETLVNVNFRPTHEGFEIDSDVLISYTKDGQKKTFGGSFIWDCAQENASAGKVIENLTINLKDIHAGAASDQNLKLLENFNPGLIESPIERLQALKLEPVWKPIPLFSTRELRQTLKPENLQSSYEGPVTLVSSEQNRIHLFPPGAYILGRGKGSQVIRTCYFDEEGYPDIYRALGVSRYHATISCQLTGFFLADGGIGPDGLHHPSSNGTFLNGEKLADGTAVPLKWKTSSEIALAHPDPDSIRAFILKASTHPDPNSGAGLRLGGGLILRRTDGATEIFIILAGTISSSVLPEIGTQCQLKHIARKFYFEHKDQRFSLTPGQTLELDDLSWTCQTFQQYGLG